MSTKRLQRTVIEGGRRNTDERRKSHKEQRATERAYMAAITKDPENFDEIALEETDHVYKEFSDKLNPMERWIEAQVGRRWSDVRSEVAQKFDTRTTAGRHITFDHLLSSVVDTRSGRDKYGYIADASLRGTDGKRGFYIYHDYFVNENDILCKNPKNPRSWYKRTYAATPEQLVEIGHWLQGRMIGEKGGVLYWFAPNEGVWQSRWSEEMEETPYGIRKGWNRLRYFSSEIGQYHVYCTDGLNISEKILRTGLHWKYIANPAGFKQRGPLSQEDIKTFKSFPEGSQNEILAFGNERFGK